MDPQQPSPLTLQDFIQVINAALAPLTTAATSASASPMARPATFSGDTVNCSGFILQCSLYFEMQPRAFPMERSKIAFMITLLSGRALQWAESLWNSDSPVTQTFDDFTTHFKEVFGQAGSELSVQDCLIRLSQVRSSVWDYSVQFRTLAASSG